MQRLNLIKTTEFRVLLGVACGLTAVYVLLFFSTLAAEGLGGFFLLVEYTFWAGVAGVILVIVAFFFGWLPYHEWWMVSALAAWVLVPIVGGFFAALAILWGFESLYASPEFAIWYRGAADISIVPEDPTIAYAGCRPGTYSATYHITATRPIDLQTAARMRLGRSPSTRRLPTKLRSLITHPSCWAPAGTACPPAKTMTGLTDL